MAISEIFKNPTVKQVIFQIKFPNLFFIESKIGDFQMKIMDDFPESALIFRQPLFFTDSFKEQNMDELKKDVEPMRKIWQFKGINKYKLNVTCNSLDISSEFYKTYNNENSKQKFRDIIQKCVDSFLELTNLKTINRIGLRYIDDCPIPAKKDNDKFLEYYNSVLPFERFNLKDTSLYKCKIETKRDDCFLRYSEYLDYKKEKPLYLLDFDGFQRNISSSDYLTITDKLHDIISNEYESIIKEPVIKIMRK